MPRPIIFGYLAVLIAIMLAGLFMYSLYILTEANSGYSGVDLTAINSITFYAVAIPIGLVSLAVIGTGFWIGWTLLTIKVVPPMHDMADKKDFSKIKAFFLCLGTMILGLLLLY